MDLRDIINQPVIKMPDRMVTINDIENIVDLLYGTGRTYSKEEYNKHAKVAIDCALYDLNETYDKEKMTLINLHDSLRRIGFSLRTSQRLLQSLNLTHPDFEYIQEAIVELGRVSILLNSVANIGAPIEGVYNFIDERRRNFNATGK